MRERVRERGSHVVIRMECHLPTLSFPLYNLIPPHKSCFPSFDLSFPSHNLNVPSDDLTFPSDDPSVLSDDLFSLPFVTFFPLR